ncbi:MAG: dTDP-4-dehydrorhamnose reductase [Chloroflexi bacterium]|nr:dTDP-4-dehydrorhamnose reductase [Chloroflexota bacterium]
MRILITGGHGQLGQSLVRALSAHDASALSHAELDVADARSVDRAFGDHRPRVAVHTAALTDTARCEREPDAARAINAAGTENVARACARSGARLIAISTNEVFDGQKRAPYAESDVARAVNAYGQSKLEGERLASAACPDTLIARTSWLYGDGGNNFVEKVRAAAQSGRKLSFVTDEIASPTATADLAQAIRALIERSAPPGIYHLANEGAASRYDWAREILRLTGLDVPIEAVTTEQLRAGGYAGPPKPAYSVLANARARALGIALAPWRDALAAYFERARVAADG